VVGSSNTFAKRCRREAIPPRCHRAKVASGQSLLRPPLVAEPEQGRAPEATRKLSASTRHAQRTLSTPPSKSERTERADEKTRLKALCAKSVTNLWAFVMQRELADVHAALDKLQIRNEVIANR